MDVLTAASCLLTEALPPAKADVTLQPCGCVHEVFADHARIYQSMLYPKVA